jgi:hypothetical protein
MPPNTHKRKETSWQMGRIFEAHLFLRSITPRLLRYTWGFDEGRISDAHLYNNCYRLSELLARLIHVRKHLYSSVDLFLSDSNNLF